ncbi:MAG: serine hydrolase [Terriglobia bacterium]
MRRLPAGLLIFSFAFWLGVAAAAAQPAVSASPEASKANLEGLDEFIVRVMKEWKVPGLALAIVKDGEVIHAKGYGYRDVEKKLAVTPRTLFAIGSITKSFTVTALGILADEGKLDWDKPVREYLPDFRLYDPVASAQMTPRDLVTHRSGLPRHDGLWYGSDFTRKQMYQRLRYLKPSKPFRSTWQYQNLMFMTAGYLAGQLGGMKWEEVVRQKILEPLGMARSNFSVNASQQADDFALPYRKVKEEVKKVPFRNIDEVGPAGSINSTVEEMIRYVQFHINKGKQGDKQLLSKGNAEQMQTPQMVMPGTIQYDELGHTSYGMGFAVSSYRGQKLVSHGGGIDGFISLLSFMPRKKIGLIVLTNLSGNNPVPAVVTRNVYDRLLGLEEVDWVSRIKEQQKKAEQARAEAKKKGYTERKKGTSPSHPLADYAGNYQHPGYGVVKIEVEGSDLKASRNSNMIAPLKHFHYDIFEVPEDPMNPLEGAKVTFFYNKNGDIDRVVVPLEPNVGDIIFTRVAEEAMKQRSFLEAFVGEYELGPTTVSVALRGEATLTLTVPGQPTYELVPLRGTSFGLKGLSGFSLEFKQDAAGAVTEAVFYQPNGTFVAKKK